MEVGYLAAYTDVASACKCTMDSRNTMRTCK